MASEALKALRDRKREEERTAGHLADAPKVDKATALRCELRDRLLAKVAEHKAAAGAADPKVDSQIRNLSQALATAPDPDKANRPRQRREPKTHTWQRRTVRKARHYTVKAAHWQPITWHGKP